MRNLASLAKAGRAFGTEERTMEVLSSTEFDANMVLQAMVMESLFEQEGMQARIRLEQEEEDAVDHGAYALQLLSTCYREESEPELDERLQYRPNRYGIRIQG